MNIKTRESIAKTLSLILANCNRKPTDLQSLNIAWHIGLEDFSDEQVLTGAKKCVQNWDSSYPPTIRQFREYCIALPGSPSLSAEADQAWAVVINNLIKSYHDLVVFKNSAIAEAVRGIGGRKVLIETEENALHFLKKDFVKLYKCYRSMGNDYDPVLSQDWKKHPSHVPFDDERSSILFLGFNSPEEGEKLLSDYQSLSTQQKICYEKGHVSTVYPSHIMTY